MRITSERRSLLILLLFRAVCGCQSIAAPDPGPGSADVPPTLGVDSLAVGQVLFACGDWVTDMDGWAYFDIVLARHSADMPDDRPSPEHVDTLERAGVVIVQEMSFQAVRAIAPVDTLSGLWPGTVAYVLEVPYTDRSDFEVSFGFSSGEESEWRALIEGAGGKLTSAIPSYGLAFGILPNDQASVVRASPIVEFVEMRGRLCPLGASD